LYRLTVPFNDMISVRYRYRFSTGFVQFNGTVQRYDFGTVQRYDFGTVLVPVLYRSTVQFRYDIGTV